MPKPLTFIEQVTKIQVKAFEDYSKIRMLGGTMESADEVMRKALNEISDLCDSKEAELHNMDEVLTTVLSLGF